ncbi:MAG: hypothetical protein M3466_10735, partial [Gemmatimonadota bacterium]|nr:hypothetical protein [Gemmatimonadota bacterium]
FTPLCAGAQSSNPGDNHPLAALHLVGIVVVQQTKQNPNMQIRVQAVLSHDDGISVTPSSATGTGLRKGLSPGRVRRRSHIHETNKLCRGRIPLVIRPGLHDKIGDHPLPHDRPDLLRQSVLKRAKGVSDTRRAAQPQ